MKVIFTIFTNFILRENLLQYKIFIFIKFQDTFSSDIDWVTYLTKMQQNLCSIFYFSIFWNSGGGETVTSSFGDASKLKEHQGGKMIKKSQTTREEPMT